MSHKIVVVVPIYKELSPKELISLKVLKQNIKEYNKVIVCPLNYDLSKIDTKGFKIKKLSSNRFKKERYGLYMLLSRKFYSYFKDYDYMLYHKPGCVVFGNDNDLSHWADKEFSYIGAPWFKKNSENRRSLPSGVGVGSLSLRKIGDFLKVFDRRRVSIKARNRQSKSFFSEWRYWSRLKRISAWVHLQQLIRNKGAVHHLARKFDKPEDFFWAFFAIQIFKGFKIPSFDSGYRFAIEYTPYRVFDNSLPFGITDKPWVHSTAWDAIVEKTLKEHDTLKKEKKETKKVPLKKKAVKKTTNKKTASKKSTTKKTGDKKTVTKAKKKTPKKVSK